MKKIVLSMVGVVSIVLSSGEMVEPATESSTKAIVEENISNKEILALKEQMVTMQDALTKLENKKVSEAKHKGVWVKSKVPVLKFSGTHYLGFVNAKDGNDIATNKFQTRRNYFQVKAYMEENSKDYMRLTLDTHDDSAGESGVRLKYAFLYLDNILPNTGVEIGQAHRPWIDYEEHNSWNYRSISKVMVEEKKAGHLTNSADRGINFKTKTPYFSSELGLFNGEGYHNKEDGRRLSGEWRLTGHILGTGRDKAKKSATYANLSFFGQQNKMSNKHNNQDLNWMGLHAVYNQPEFLVSAQYIDVADADPIYKGKGYSVNGEYRVSDDWNLIGRYDFFDMDDNSGEKKRALAGVSYEYNDNVEFIANYLKEDGSALGSDNSQDALMLTAQVEW
jgi:hypothetical protein